MKKYAILLRSPLTALAIFFFIAILLMQQSAIAQTLYSLTIYNNTNYDINNLYITRVGNRSQGDDRLGNDVLEAGDNFMVTLRPGRYNVTFVDEDGERCLEKDVKIFVDTSWALTNDWLYICEGHRTGERASPP